MAEDFDKEMQAIAKKLRQLRIEMGYTSYRTFAHEKELSDRSLFRMESGENFGMQTFLKTLKALEITPEDFFKDLGLEGFRLNQR
mgnify:CR=1 FL=1